MIHARALARSFKNRKEVVEAVRGVDLEVSAREIVGFLGPNGAGKTTTLRMLTTLLAPTSGTATVAGHDLAADPLGVRRAIGYVPQGGSTYILDRVGEALTDQARLHGIGKAEAARRSRGLLDRLDLAGLWDRPTAAMSGGQRRRLDIAMGLVHDPALIFLDEPTTGLDPQARANLWEHIRDLRSAHGSTVFLTTHYLDEADALCDRIFVIDDGRIVGEGTPDELKRRVSGDAVALTLAAGADPSAALTAVGGLTQATETRTTAEADGTVQLTFRIPDGGRALPGLLHRLETADVALDAVQVHRPTLDDVFLAMTGRSLREDAA